METFAGNFGPILGASGVQGFFGEGYLHHKFLKPFGCNFNGITFVSKTTTLNEREGNMPMKEDGITPKELLPKCVVVNFRKQIMLNAVGLSGPGAKALFKDGRWQKRTEPFYISFMSVEDTPEKRLAELKEFIQLFITQIPYFKTRVGIQINKSCPNVKLSSGEKLDPTLLVGEIQTEAAVIGNLFAQAGYCRVPTIWKFNALISPDIIRAAFRNNTHDAICVSNTFPWGKLPEKIDWTRLFGTENSPFAKLGGGGGLSGKPLLPIVADWVKEARRIGIKNHINAGGGVLRPQDIITLKDAGASSVFIGCVATLRPWRVASLIHKAHEIF